MGQVGRRVAAALLVLGAAACASASGSVVTLSSYAAGTWNCTAKVSAGGHTYTLKPKGVVAASSTTTGNVAITIPFPESSGTEKLSGEWKLSGSDLTVQWSKHDQGTAEAKPVTLATKQFRIKSGTPGNAKWSKVTVDRKSRSVTFGFPIFPGGPSGATMTCRKA